MSTTIQMPTTHQIVRYGWRPDLPDHRDRLLTVDVGGIDPHRLPPVVDLEQSGFLPNPGYDQLQLGSCTENATAADLRFVLRKAGQVEILPSRLYIYYMARLIEGTVHYDAGSSIRDAMKVSAKGFIPESEWTYDIATFATPPMPIQRLIEDAKKDHVVQYVRVFRDGGMRSCLASGYPFVFGISVYGSFEQASNGEIPMPSPSESLLGGHALLCVGYDAPNRRYKFLNSWGQKWGRNGYGTLPYDYLHRSDLSSDFWSIRTENVA